MRNKDVGQNFFYYAAALLVFQLKFGCLEIRDSFIKYFIKQTPRLFFGLSSPNISTPLFTVSGRPVYTSVSRFKSHHGLSFLGKRQLCTILAKYAYFVLLKTFQ
jgi:hypothetical protein